MWFAFDLGMFQNLWFTQVISCRNDTWIGDMNLGLHKMFNLSLLVSWEDPRQRTCWEKDLEFFYVLSYFRPYRKKNHHWNTIPPNFLFGEYVFTLHCSNHHRKVGKEISALTFAMLYSVETLPRFGELKSLFLLWIELHPIVFRRKHIYKLQYRFCNWFCKWNVFFHDSGSGVIYI